MFFLKSKFLVWFSVFIYLFFLGLVFFEQGIIQDKEALKYIRSAESLLQGDFNDFFFRYKLYASYILFLSPFVLFEFLIGAILVQVMLNFYAGLALKNMIFKFTESHYAASLIFLFYLLSFSTGQWILSYYTEGLFIPVSLLFLYSVYFSKTNNLLIILFAVVLIFLRPTGILLVLPVLLNYFDFKRLQLLVFVILPVVFLTAPILPKDQLQGIAQNHVILGNPENPEINHAPNLDNLWDVQYLVIQDHGLQKWFSLFTGRILSLFNPMRDWFSLSHNLLVSPLFLFYLFALIALFLDAVNRKLIVTLIMVIALNAILVGLTYDEWDARFLSSTIPIILFLSGLGLASFFKINRWSSKTH